MRRGAGRKGRWNNGETQTIRVPVAIKEDLINLGQALDQGHRVLSGHTLLELEDLLERWDAKCASNAEDDGLPTVRQLLTEIREILAENACHQHGHAHSCAANCQDD